MRKYKIPSVVCACVAIFSFNANAVLYDNYIVLVGDEFIQNNSDKNTFTNNLTINGLWSLNGANRNTNMDFSGTQTLGGTGELVMTDSTRNRLRGDGANTLTVGTGLTIRGAGKILTLTELINGGSILAQGTNRLLIQIDALTNNGTLRAEGAGGLRLSGVNVSNNTSVDVAAGSLLDLRRNAVIDGVINVAATGTAIADKTTFDGVTLNGDMQQNNRKSNTVTNGLTLNGAWNLNSTGGRTRLTFNGTQSIGGVGEIVMSDSTGNRIQGNGNDLTAGAGTTIRGAGQIGLNINSFQNFGFMRAQGINQELLIQSNSLINSGLLSAEGSGGLNITSANFTTSGLVEVLQASVLNRTGDYIQTNGITHVDGTLNVTGSTDIQGGTLSGNGQINSTGIVANSGTVAPGDSPGKLTITGDFSQSLDGILEAEIAGLVAGTEYDWLDISGTASLAGTLKVSLFDSGSGLFAPSLGDTFDILSATDITGIFDILLLAPLGSGLNWDVGYILDPLNTDFVRLSVVSAVSVPPAVWLFASGLLGLVGVARRTNGVKSTFAST